LGRRLTYIRIRSSFVYLAAILDLYSGKVVGWAISKRIDTELCLTALRMAVETRPSHGSIHHSDRGVQYASADYVNLLRHHGLQISMSRKGNPYDSAFMESFYKTFKYEEVLARRLISGIENILLSAESLDTSGYFPFRNRHRNKVRTDTESPGHVFAPVLLLFWNSEFVQPFRA
jgi:transposase InsO family protein